MYKSYRTRFLAIASIAAAAMLASSVVRAQAQHDQSGYHKNHQKVFVLKMYPLADIGPAPMIIEAQSQTGTMYPVGITKLGNMHKASGTSGWQLMHVNLPDNRHDLPSLFVKV